MKIYIIELDMTLILPRLKNFRLGEFNHEYPYIFIEADNPDDACYLAYCKFSEVLLKQDESTETAMLIKDVFNGLKIRKVYCKDET